MYLYYNFKRNAKTYGNIVYFTSPILLTYEKGQLLILETYIGESRTYKEILCKIVEVLPQKISKERIEFQYVVKPVTNSTSKEN